MSWDICFTLDIYFIDYQSSEKCTWGYALASEVPTSAFSVFSLVIVLMCKYFLKQPIYLFAFKFPNVCYVSFIVHFALLLHLLGEYGLYDTSSLMFIETCLVTLGTNKI